MNNINENIIKLQNEYKRQICYSVEEKCFYIFGLEYEKNYILYELSGGGASQSHLKKDTTLIFLNNKHGSHKSSQKTPKIKENKGKNIAELPQKDSKTPAIYSIKIGKDKQIDSILIPNCWYLNNRPYQKFSFNESDLNKKAILQDFENRISDIISKGNQPYTYEKMIKKLYEPVIKLINNNKIAKVEIFRQELIKRQQAQRNTIIINQKIKTEKMRRKTVTIVKCAIIFFGIIILLFQLRKPFRENNNISEPVVIEYVKKSQLNNLINEYENENNISFTDYRKNLIFESLPDSFEIATAKNNIDLYFKQLKK